MVCGDHGLHKRKAAMLLCSTITLVLMLSWCCWISISPDPVFSSGLHKGLFPPNSVVDISNGSISSLFDYIREHQLTFVVFYAPWSGQCIKVVSDIIDAHKRIKHPMVAVAAINCWVGRCREVFPTLSFPRMFVYHTNHDPVEYFDEVDSNKIIQFLKISIRPWVYIGSQAQMDIFLKLYDNMVICYMNPADIQKNERFNVMFQTSLLLINKENHLRVGIISNPQLAASFKLHRHGQLISRTLFRSDMYYPELIDYTSANILKWMEKHSKQLVNALSLQPANSQYYTNQFKEGPVLLLVFSQKFTAKHVLKQYREAALAYYRCGCPQKSCENVYLKKLCSSFVVSGSAELCTICQHCTYDNCLCRDKTIEFIHKYKSQSDDRINQGYQSDGCMDHGSPSDCTNSFVNSSICFSIPTQSYYYQDRFVKCCNVTRTTYQSKRTKKVSSSKTGELLHKYIQLDKHYQSQNNLLNCGASVPCCFGVTGTRNVNELNYTGLACHTNRTLGFYMMEYEKHSFILKNMNVVSLPSLVIVDMKLEQNYILEASLSRRSLEMFVLNYTAGQLDPISTTVKSSHKPPHSIDALTQPSSAFSKTNIKITELDSNNFQRIVFKSEKSVLVMFYSAWCGVCKIVNLIYLNVARIYTAHDVHFTRINSDVNQLPWRFVPSYYPSFILFPASRKDDSISYPEEDEITVENLKTFLDNNLNKKDF